MRKALILIVLLAALALPALAEDALVIDGVTFSPDGRTLIEYPVDKPDEYYAVPDGVVTIGDGAFFQNEHIVHVTLPDSVESIGVAAFQFCTALRQIDMPEQRLYPWHTITLGQGSFASTALTELTIPFGVKDLPSELLNGMHGLTDLHLPRTLLTIAGKGLHEDWSFDEAAPDTGWFVLHAPEDCTAAEFARQSGEPYVLDGYSAHKKSTASVVEALHLAMAGDLEGWRVCTDEYGKPLLTYSAEDVLAFITDGDRTALLFAEWWDGRLDWYARSDTPLFGVEEGLTPIAIGLADKVLRCSLRWDGRIVWLTVENNVNGWGGWYVTEYSFGEPDGDGWHMTARYVPDTPPLVEGFTLVQGEQAPVVIEGDVLVEYPASRTDAHYTVPEGVEIIGEYAFAENPYLIRVTLPESVRVIGDSAFADCWSLRIVDMPSTLESIGACAFEYTGVQHLTIPDGLTSLPAHAFAAADLQGTVVIPEGVTDIDMECFVFNDDITDLYLPASLQTIEGKTFEQGASFGYIWDFNSINEGEIHMTVHAPAGTEAARFARFSGEPYVIEDARSGTDLPAVAAQVEAVLNEVYPAAALCVNPYGYPCVTYSADTVFAFAQRAGGGWYDENLLCCFDRTAEGLTLRFINDGLYWNEYPQGWPETTAPLDMQLIGDTLTLGLQPGEETAIFLTFKGGDFRLTRTTTCIWKKYTDGPPPYWQTQFSLPVTDGPSLRDFTLIRYTPGEQVVQGAYFTGDGVLLRLYDVIGAAGIDLSYEYNAAGIARFEIDEVRYELNEQAMTLTIWGEDDPVNLIMPAPGSDGFCSEIRDGMWLVDADTVYCTFCSILGWPIRLSIDENTQTVTVRAEGKGG